MLAGNGDSSFSLILFHCSTFPSPPFLHAAVSQRWDSHQYSAAALEFSVLCVRALLFLTFIVIVDDVFGQKVVVAEDGWRVNLREVSL